MGVVLTRLLRLGVASVAVAIVGTEVPQLTRAVHAQDVAQSGSCSVSARAGASSFDHSASGSASGSVSVDGYTFDDCVSLAQTNGIFVSGTACENAGIPAGVQHYVGYAIVNWSGVWQNLATGEQTAFGPTLQEWDCGDTFS
jgi:hypothetical protein